MTNKTMGTRNVCGAVLASILATAFGCSDGDTHYDIAPSYDGGQGRGHKDDGPSPYVQLCDIKRTTCGGGGATCEEIRYADDTHGTVQSTSVCTAPCTSIESCNQAPAGANHVACVQFASNQGRCLFVCDAAGACPTGLACKQGICVRPTG